MDVLTFITTLVGHLAWPIAITVLFLCFRKPIADRIGAIKRLKYQDLELDLSEELQHLAASAVDAKLMSPPKERPLTTPPISGLEQARAVTRTAPPAAILLAWVHLEETLLKTVARLAIAPDPPSHRTISTSIEDLRRAERLDAKSVKLLQGLQRVRNAVAHHGYKDDILPATAERFVDLVEAVVATLNGL